MKISIWRRNLRLYVSVRKGDMNNFLGGVRIAPVFFLRDMEELLDKNRDFLGEMKISEDDLSARLIARASVEAVDLGIVE